PALNWAPRSNGRSTWSNPLSWLESLHGATTRSLLGNLNVSYELYKGLTVRSNFGISDINQTEYLTVPISSLDPTSAFQKLGRSTRGTNNRNNWIIEPQVDFSRAVGMHRIAAIVGGTMQQVETIKRAFFGTGYTSDTMLESIAAAPELRSIDSNNQYRYSSMFARINYTINDKYLCSLTGRRDGSSRFGPGRRFGNIGSIGIAWIFSRENLIANNARIISFGKLRTTVGTTGNDQIGDSK
ncbi:TonB-dependent receptor, partial [Fulvivirgaceae bacterium PWU5]|nr:TonB-dependent receptor [Dawidia cretensis]